MEGRKRKKRRARIRETDKLVHLDPDDPEACKKSLYYWWWVYLRENKEYKETCANRGAGESAELYKDFGDIYDRSFAAWWKEKIWILFGEPWQGTMAERLRDRVQKILDSRDNSDKEIWVELKIPLHVSGHRVATFLAALIEREQGRLSIDTDKWNCKPKYELASNAQTRKLDVDLKILEAKTVTDYQDWKLGVKFELSPGLSPDQPPDAGRMYRLRHTVYERRKRAKGRIFGAARGNFPGKNPYQVRDDFESSS